MMTIAKLKELEHWLFEEVIAMNELYNMSSSEKIAGKASEAYRIYDIFKTLFKDELETEL